MLHYYDPTNYETYYWDGMVRSILHNSVVIMLILAALQLEERKKKKRVNIRF